MDSAKETELRERLLPPDFFPYDLLGNAAQEAAQVLADNWVDAIDCGEPLRALIEDVDEVVALLQHWKAHLEGQHDDQG